MRLILLLSFVSLLGQSTACASSDTSTRATDAAAISNGGSSGAGGSGGANSTGGATASTGGKNPADCPADSGTETCRQCLAANCCTAYENCVRDDICARALETYRQCANTAVSGSDKGRCFAAFGRTMKDAGASSAYGSAVATCVYQSCIACGASSI
jgi:hypothetical protein